MLTDLRGEIPVATVVSSLRIRVIRRIRGYPSGSLSLKDLPNSSPKIFSGNEDSLILCHEFHESGGGRTILERVDRHHLSVVKISGTSQPALELVPGEVVSPGPFKGDQMTTIIYKQVVTSLRRDSGPARQSEDLW